MNKKQWLELFQNRKDDLTNIVARFEGATEPEWKAAVESNDPVKLGGILQTTWEKAPDKPWIHDLPSWRVLCDLCSEYCFGEIQDEE